MKSFFLSAIVLFFISSCTQVNSNGEKTITQGEDTISDVNISLSKMDAVEELADVKEETKSKLIFKASGTEPGWYADFYSNKLRLIVDYNKDSLILEHKFELLDDKNGYVFETESAAQNKMLSIKIENKTCIAAGSGDKEDRAVTIIYKGKTYKGCGSFIK